MAKLPKPPKEVPRIKSLDELVIGFRKRVNIFFTLMHEYGSIGAYAGETFRTEARQAYLAGFGRKYDDGRGIVTQAFTAETSLHAYRCAVDIWDSTNLKKPYTPLNPKKFYADMKAACIATGVRWGGDWNNNGKEDEKFPDKPHIQDLRAPIRPDTIDIKTYHTGDLTAFFNRYNIEY